jgi:hypothetical protein
MANASIVVRGTAGGKRVNWSLERAKREGLTGAFSKPASKSLEAPDSRTTLDSLDGGFAYPRINSTGTFPRSVLYLN